MSTGTLQGRQLPVTAHYATTSDARIYELASGIIALGLIASYLAVALHVMPIWLLVTIVALLLPRWMIYTHELFHIRKANEVTWLTRLMILPFTPVSLGYPQFREIHLGHHKAPATADDPDAFHILGGPIKAFLGALISIRRRPMRPRIRCESTSCLTCI